MPRLEATWGKHTQTSTAQGDVDTPFTRVLLEGGVMPTERAGSSAGALPTKLLPPQNTLVKLA